MTNPSIGIAAQARSRLRNLSLPVWLILICVVTFSVLLGAGAAISKYAPPQPAIVETPQHEVVFTAADVENGQVTYLGRGGQHIGSIWGHGSYLAPDWTADVLHRWGLATAGVLYANDPSFSQADLEALSPTEQAVLKAQVMVELGVQFLGVGFDSFFREHLAHFGAAAGVANHGSAAAHQANGPMPGFLQVHHGHNGNQMAGVQAVGGAVKAYVKGDWFIPQ